MKQSIADYLEKKKQWGERAAEADEELETTRGPNSNAIDVKSGKY